MRNTAPIFCCLLLRLRPLLEFYFRGEDNFAGGKFREIPFAVDIIFAGGKFRAKSKFANIAKMSSTRKIGVIQYSVERECDPSDNSASINTVYGISSL